MALTNRQRVENGLDLLQVGLVPFMERELKQGLGDTWADQVASGQRQGLKRNPDGSVQWEPQLALKVMIDNWNGVFRNTLGHFERSLVGELLEHRNRWAHNQPFSSDEALRALDSARLLLLAVTAPDQAREVDDLKADLQRQVFAEQARQKTRKVSAIEVKAEAGLKPWREVIAPHPDVSSGRYAQAEFAADLAQVARGEGSDEYRHPGEFFRRTFVTDGLRALLVGAVQRLTGSGGDPVVELQTNFGGGKTHCMLALYHLFGPTRTSDLLGMDEVLLAARVPAVRPARRAVLVGTALSPGQVSCKPDGTEVHTLWGEMAWQLGGKEAFDVIAASDKRGTSPGSQDLAALFNKLGTCLVLVDEWVAYARQLVGKRGLPAGDFEAQVSFAQALSEAARAARQTLVVASIPASKIEIGGEHGDYALDALKNAFERVGTPWRPASADEGFEIVRRRLFEPLVNKDRFVERDQVVGAFARMYQATPADYPAGCGDGAYRHKLETAYPIHPELFDRLYGEWSTLDKFQRTRGVLRLLAKVIHRLWESGDSSLLILPSMVPMDDGAVKSELTRYLADVWEPIISEDVDGPNSLPLEIDQNTPNLGRYSACRRVARSLYIGTAPGAEGKNPGLDDRSVRLGCTQPGESAATFGDALRRISERAKHIHQDGNRYWVSTKANLNRVAEDRANSFMDKPEELHEEIRRRLREDKTRGDFKGVHRCPGATSEVGDEPEARLVILDPKVAHRKSQDLSPAMVAAKELLASRGNQQRLNRNTLVFLAADQRGLGDLMQGVAQYLAWQSILDDEETLDLAVNQRRQAQTKVKDANNTVELRLQETWVHALVPTQATATAEITWDEIRIAGNDTLAKRTAAKLKADELLLPQMGGGRLRMELDRFLWTDKDHVSVGQLAEWFPRYLYLPRITERDVIVKAVQENSLLDAEGFYVATAFDPEKGRYLGLQYRAGSSVTNATLLVKPDVARRQLEEDKKPKCPKCGAKEPAWNKAAGRCTECGHGKPTCPRCGAADPTWNDQDQKCSACRYPEPPPPKCPKCSAPEPEWNATEGRCRRCGFPPKPPKARCPACGEPEPVWQPVEGRCTACGYPKADRRPTIFVGSVQLDAGRVGRDAGRVADEVLSHLTTLVGAKAKITLEIQVEVKDGISDDVVRIVTENAKTLKFEGQGFEKE